MERLPTFSLFPDPLREGVIKRSSESCEICGRSRRYIYTGPQFARTSDELVICPWCIADGSASKRGIAFNDGETGKANPALIIQDGEILYDSSLLIRDSDIASDRTPGFQTRRGNYWQDCCGRACIYLGEAFAADLKGRWASAVPTMFDRGSGQEEIDHIVSEFSGDLGRGAYVFQCQTCGKLKGY